MSLFSRQIDSRKVYDAIVVGSGLTGGWAAKELAEAGLQVLVLEAGPLISPEKVLDVTQWSPEKRLQASQRQSIQRQHPHYLWMNPNLFVDDLENPYTTPPDKPFLWIRGRQIGGRGLTWGGVTLRFSDEEFLGSEREGVGASWPLHYQELAPFYDKVERFLQVQGSEEKLPQLPDGIFTFCPLLTETEKYFKEKIESKWKNRKVIAGRGIPLEYGASEWGDTKWLPRASLNQTLPCALATGNVTLRPNSVVSHLLVDASTSHIKGVVCLDRETKEDFEVLGRVIVLCASNIESVRIMLNSKSAYYPAGVGNSSGKLGCFLLDHMAVGFNGSVPGGERVTSYPIGGANGVIIPRYNNFSEKNRDYIGGYGTFGAIQRGDLKSSSGEPRWFLFSQLEVLPREENRIKIDPTQVDAWGIKSVRISLTYSKNESRMKEDAQITMLEMIHATGLKVEQSEVRLPGQHAHELGGARMGAKPSESILNSFNQCWDAKNLFVLDGACFVTSGWQNPTLTMMALAVRACSFIVENLKTGNL